MTMQPIYVAAIAVAALACLTDLRTRRIPNWLTFGAAAVALAFHAWQGGVSGLLTSAGGWALGVALFLPFFVLRGLGGGDVKLLAALGAWLGPKTVMFVALYSSLAGGVLAILLAAMSGYLGTAPANLKFMVTLWWTTGPRPVEGLTLNSAAAPKLAYALPIFTGLVVTLWLR